MVDPADASSWRSFFIEQEGGLSFVTVDLSLVEVAPLSDLTVSIRVEVPLSKANPDPWYRTREEVERIEAVMAAIDAIAGRPSLVERLTGVAGPQLRLAGRRLRRHQCELFYYGSGTRFIARALLAVQRRFPELDLGVGSLPDPGWRVFRNALSPAPALGPLLLTWAQLEHRETLGDDRHAVRPVDHTVIFPDADGRDGFLEELRATTAGASWTFRTVDRGGGARPFAAECRVEDDLLDFTIEPHVIALATHASPFRGVHDGWGAPVVVGGAGGEGVDRSAIPGAAAGAKAG